MMPFRLLLSLPQAVAVSIGVATIAFFAWFFPWVFVLHTGLLIYFPYESNGVDRYARIAGPVTMAWKDDWVPSDTIPDHCKKALVASEDAKFFYHNGLDLESMEQSYRANERTGRIARGGSTITQQLVKNAFLSRNKSYVRKAREVAGSVLLDASLSKDAQLAWYFNIVEFGPRVYGLQAAAEHYFRKEAKNLSRKECAQLVAILPAPNRWNASLVKKRTTSFFARRTGTILARMNDVTLGADESVRRELSEERRRTSLAERARSAAQKVRDTEEENEALVKAAEEGLSTDELPTLPDENVLMPPGLFFEGGAPDEAPTPMAEASPPSANPEPPPQEQEPPPPEAHTGPTQEDPNTP